MSRSYRVHAILLVGCLSIAGAARSQATRGGEVPREVFDGWIVELSNAGRWGAGDQLGTLNLITPDKRRAAAGSVRAGVSVSLARQLDASHDPASEAAVKHQYRVVDGGSGVTWTVDEISINYHGWSISHLDALSHTLYQDRLYNGYVRDHITATGSRRLGIETLSLGVVGRGVLVDLPRLHGLPYLEPKTPITPKDLEDWERKTGVRVESGDVLLIRTGRWARVEGEGEWDLREAAAGPHPSLAQWLKERGVAALGGDGTNERYPSLVPGISEPLHQLTLTAIGMPLFDNLDLEDAALEAAAQSRWTFLFVAAPLRVPGGAGSPLNPLAVF